MTFPVVSENIKAKILKVGLPLLVIVAALLGAKALLFFGPTAPRVTREVKPTLVEVLTARVRDEQAVIAAYGTVQGHQRVIVQPEISGRVVRLNPHLVLGGTLTNGTALLQIDPRDYRVALDEQRAALAKAAFDLQVELGNQAVARREWSLLKPSAGEVNTLSRHLALRRPHLREKRMALAAAKSRLRRARLNVQRTVLRAPFNAVVLEEAVEVGQLITPQSAVATLVGTDEFRVQVSVPIRQVEWMTFPGAGAPHGSPVRVLRDRGNGEPVVRQGTVVELLGDVTENGRMAQVLVSIADPLELAKPAQARRPLLLGEYVRVEIEGPELRDVVVLPREAIREGTRVWIKNAENQLVVRPVEIALSRKETVLISRGIRDGEEIITSQVPVAIPGLPLQTVEVTPAPGMASPDSGEPDHGATVSAE